MNMNRPAANTLSLEFIIEMRDTLKELESDSAVRGLILSSANPKIFCAGLDLQELVDPDPKRLHEFWKQMQLLAQDLFLTPLATVARMEGHAPAGGTVLALACDARVISAGGPRIGLNETALGLNPPWWICDLMSRVVGDARGEQLVTRGTLLDGEAAFSIGLVDDAVHNKDELDSAVMKHMKEMYVFIMNFEFILFLIRNIRRDYFGSEMRKRTDEGCDWFVERITNPIIQKPIQAYVKSLKK
eukprot:GSMAST32.ASY1.ANO1.1826.1 assembled CDS